MTKRDKSDSPSLISFCFRFGAMYRKLHDTSVTPRKSCAPVLDAHTATPSTSSDNCRVLAINVRGVYVATQAALKHMKSGGRIIMIGSAVGERVAAPGLVPYAGTKGAVKMFTQALAREIGSRGITLSIHCQRQIGPNCFHLEANSLDALGRQLL